MPAPPRPSPWRALCRRAGVQTLLLWRAVACCTPAGPGRLTPPQRTRHPPLAAPLCAPAGATLHACAHAARLTGLSRALACPALPTDQLSALDDVHASQAHLCVQERIGCKEEVGALVPLVAQVVSSLPRGMAFHKEALVLEEESPRVALQGIAWLGWLHAAHELLWLWLGWGVGVIGGFTCEHNGSQPGVAECRS